MRNGEEQRTYQYQLVDAKGVLISDKRFTNCITTKPEQGEL
jgi:hypothetical protein